MTFIGSHLGAGMVMAESSPIKNNHSDKVLHLVIKNRNTKDLNLLIKPEIPHLSPHVPDDRLKAGWLVLTVPAAPDDATSMNAVIEISSEQVGNFDYYSITGETNPLTPIGTCYNLQKGKSYRIEFTNNILGTGCIGTELKEPVPIIENGVEILPIKKVTTTLREGISRQPHRPSEVLTPDK
ncbi:hypothetical protein [Candidatus Odyssella acanthamoebae]|uniref:Uncharacterized protein n=1 Tax=Candidatus Odyssella acanthamoebae TaxID=91604 RepID=A0A077AUX5_9PROT|nr:hypothetical protein [Candidatus Paracaedibacter acanthamoebae]AIK96962.1 hypothetical protein ID47_09835 [Candidatus Paracaedibacter acanthamoebae]